MVGDMRLLRDQFALPAAALAPRLLGCTLVRVLPGGERLAGIIVETEAYVGVEDRASHAFGGRRTPRNESMYGDPGTCYVYFTYGMHHCVNVVCSRRDDPQAVLIRALEPVEGVDLIRRRRGGKPPASCCDGPGKLCEAMAIDRSLDGLDLAASETLWIEGRRGGGTPPVRTAARVGIGDKGVWTRRRLRWLVRGHPHVSVPAD
ncbi:MAG: N-methylpurine glycosylase [Planctomycetota bacterium]|jgi:DNA-3-methyladenine glycosylase